MDLANRCQWRVCLVLSRTQQPSVRSKCRLPITRHSSICPSKWKKIYHETLCRKIPLAVPLGFQQNWHTISFKIVCEGRARFGISDHDIHVCTEASINVRLLISIPLPVTCPASDTRSWHIGAAPVGRIGRRLLDNFRPGSLDQRSGHPLLRTTNLR